MSDSYHTDNPVTVSSYINVNITPTNLIVCKTTRDKIGTCLNSCNPTPFANCQNSCNSPSYNNCQTSCYSSYNNYQNNCYQINEIVPWVINITNTGDVPATNVVITEPLPQYFVFIGQNNWIKQYDGSYQYYIDSIQSGNQYSIPFYVKIIGPIMGKYKTFYNNVATINYNCNNTITVNDGIFIYGSST